MDIHRIFAEFDRLNMTPIIEAVGGTFDPEGRYQKILEEKKKGAIFLPIEKRKQIVGYLEYMEESEGVWKIMSIQIHPENKGSMVIRDLLSKAREQLDSVLPKLIKSSVHVSNDPSLNLHHKLGFVEVKKDKDRILFEITGEDLKQNLKKYHKWK